MVHFLQCLYNVLTLIIMCGTFCYYYLTSNFNYFKDRGVKYSKPLPFVGNMGRMVILKDHMVTVVKKNYDLFKNEKYFGLFSYSMPIVVVRDLKLIKQILVKDFYYFTDRNCIVDKNDMVLFHSLYFMKGEKWREMRTIISPMFTNSALDRMMNCTKESILRFIDDLSDTTIDGKVMEIYVKDFMTNITINIIASTLLGIDNNHTNHFDVEFYNITKEALNISGLDSVIADMVSKNPTLKKIFKGRYMPKTFEDYFRKKIIKIMEQHNRSRVVKKDLMHFMMSALSGRLDDENVRLHDDMGCVQDEDGQMPIIENGWTEEEIMAQPTLCLIASYEFIVTSLTFMAHSLAVNPDVQEKVIQEIDSYIKENNYMIKNDHLHHLKYMEMVAYETLRLWTPIGTLDRVCTKTYTLPPPNNNSNQLTINKGQNIWIPVHSIHMDPVYYPEPEQFIPERFSENKSDRDPMAFLAFGAGQRGCPGNQFALSEIKMVMFHLLAKYRIIRTAQTETYPQMKPHLFNINPTKPIHIGLKPRTDTRVIIGDV